MNTAQPAANLVSPTARIEQIAEKGFVLSAIQLPGELKTAIESRDWNKVDALVRNETLPGGAIFQELLKYAQFSEIEFIISIRSSLQEPDEDGIWHDDGSRILAFSLSLTLDSKGVEGGRLEMRKRARTAAEVSSLAAESIPTPPYGTAIIFATGYQGFEHKINKVTGGERIIIAGWCT